MLRSCAKREYLEALLPLILHTYFARQQGLSLALVYGGGRPIVAPMLNAISHGYDGMGAAKDQLAIAALPCYMART